MRHLLTPALLALLPLAACTQSGTSGGASINPGASATLHVLGSAPEVSLLNGGSASMPLEIRAAGAAAPVHDTLAPGIERWWSLDGPRTFLITNPAPSPAMLSYRVKDADVHFRTAPKP